MEGYQTCRKCNINKPLSEFIITKCLEVEDVKCVKEKGKEQKDKKEVIMKQIKIKGF